VSCKSLPQQLDLIRPTNEDRH